MIKFLKFFVSWFLTYWINMWLTLFLIKIIGLTVAIAYFISIITITVINFLISLKYVFKKAFNKFIFLKYSLVLLFCSWLNYISVLYLEKIFPEKFFYVIIFAVTSFIFFIKFIVYDKIVFLDLERIK